MESNEMRNPDRIDESQIRTNRQKSIDEMLGLISKIWHKYPDMRLLQLLLNVCLSDMDFYYMEDNLLEQWLHDHYDNI